MSVSNTKCPAYESHQENAYEQLASTGAVVSDRFSLTAEEDALVQALADDEYNHCEGH